MSAGRCPSVGSDGVSHWPSPLATTAVAGAPGALRLKLNLIWRVCVPVTGRIVAWTETSRCSGLIAWWQAIAPGACRGGGVTAWGRDANAAGAATASTATRHEQIIARRFIYNPLTTARAGSCSDRRYVS